MKILELILDNLKVILLAAIVILIMLLALQHILHIINQH